MRIAHVLLDASSEEGLLAASLCRTMQEAGHRSLICYAIGFVPGDVAGYRIGNRPGPKKRKWFRKRMDRLLIRVERDAHLYRSRITDRSGFYSAAVTDRLIRQLQSFQPDLVHLQRLHGYALHLPKLFDYLREMKIPVVWTLRDCWAWTGHCTWYTNAVNAPAGNEGRTDDPVEMHYGCDRWQTGCGSCVQQKEYPRSLVKDASARNWREKRMLFTGLPYLVLTAPSRWMLEELKSSFFAQTPAYCIPDTFDAEVFQPPRDDEQLQIILRYYKIDTRDPKPLILTMAEYWDEHAGLSDLEEVAEKLGNHVRFGVIGLDKLQRSGPLPDHMRVIPTPRSQRDLAVLLYAADLFVCLSHGEANTLPVLKALACGTRALCFEVSALAEAACPGICETVPLRDDDALAREALRMIQLPRNEEDCRNHALRHLPDYQQNAYKRLYENLYKNAPAYLAMAGSAEPADPGENVRN